MRNLTSKKLTVGICVFAAALFCGQALDGIPNNSGCDEGVHVQIITDKTSYAPGAIMHVKLLVTNISDKPLYLFRSAGQCTSPYGWFSASLYDHRNRRVGFPGCSVDAFDVGTEDMVKTLTNPALAVLLKTYEIHGREEDYSLPKQKGTYWLHGELAPPGLTDDQKQALAEHHIRILRSTCSAPPVRITVK